MSFYGRKMFEVKCVDRLTGDSLGISMSDSARIPTQEAAELKIAIQHTPYAGQHPGYDIIPKDVDKFTALWDKWVSENPKEAQKVLDRPNWANDHPVEAASLKAAIVEAEKKANEKKTPALV